eukprot:COSAG05_NODE_538_length_8854_cov_306.308738_8_plen_119_part_00
MLAPLLPIAAGALTLSGLLGVIAVSCLTGLLYLHVVLNCTLFAAILFGAAAVCGNAGNIDRLEAAALLDMDQSGISLAEPSVREHCADKQSETLRLSHPLAFTLCWDSLSSPGAKPPV